MLSSVAIGCIVLSCVFGGGLLGLFLRNALPSHHLNSESKDLIKMGTGLVGTMTALLLGLLVASAKSAYDTEQSELTQMSAKVIFLDRVLANYGPEAAESRQVLHNTLARAIDRMWPNESAGVAQLDPSATGREELFISLQQMAPQNDMQRFLKSQALAITSDLGQTRWLLFEQTGVSISVPFLSMVVLWLTVIFVSFGLFAPANTTTVTALFMCAISVSSALFLVLELSHPFVGVIKISSAPMRGVLEHLGK
jgi:hypothetical protein